MYGLISPKGKIAALCSGQEASLFGFGGDLVAQKDISEVEHLFCSYDDIIKIKNPTKNQLIKILNFEYKKIESVYLLLTVLDNNIDETDKFEVCNLLELLLDEVDVLIHLERTMYAHPLPESIEFSHAFCEQLKVFSKLESFLINLIQHQEKISYIFSVWNSIVLRNISIEDHLLVNGIYANSGFAVKYAQSALKQSEVSTFMFEFLNKSGKVSGSRAAISIFFKELNIKVEPSSKRIKIEPEVEEIFENHSKKTSDKARRKFEQVTAQINNIKAHLENNNLSKAKQFAAELVKQQVASGDAGFAARSLSTISEYAKGLCHYDLMVQWAAQAVEVNPLDERATSQLGDAYLINEDYELARVFFEMNVNISANKSYSLAGLARLYRAKHDYDLALNYIEQACAHCHEPRNEAMRAEILKDLGRYVEAEALYKKIIEGEQQPSEPGFRCGLAAILAEQGNFAEAEAVYKKSIELWPTDPVPNTGLGFLLAKQGKFKDAFKYLDEGMKFGRVGNFIPVTAKASALRMAGKYDEAELLLRKMLKLTPHIIEYKVSLLDVMISRGHLQSALDLCISYQNSIFDKEKNSLLRMQALIYRKQGELKKSLSIIDGLCQRHPKWLLVLCDKADLLRNMGLLDDANSIYSAVLDVHKGYRRAINGVRLSNALTNNLGDEFNIVEHVQPITYEDWEMISIESLIFLLTRQYSKARKLLHVCKVGSPFKTIIDSVVIPQSTAQLGLGNHEKALNLISSLSSNNAVLQKVLIYCRMGDVGRARKLLNNLVINQDIDTNVISLIQDTYFDDKVASNDDFFNILDESVRLMLKAA
jgi:tetratricopeptide (TPR) repeat protein